MADDNRGEIIIYTDPTGLARVQMRFTDGKIWMKQDEIASLFGRDLSVISRHIANVLTEGELPEESNLQKMQIAGSTKPVTLYSFDMIVSVGYRVSSKQATQFRQWATRIINEYAVKGHVVDVERLKDPDASDYFNELLEKINDIRSSEKHVWKRVLDLAQLCSDYAGTSTEQLQDFHATIQNTIHWAVTQHTAAEIIDDRVDSSLPHCGVMSFTGSEPTVAEAHVAKNYYGTDDLNELNRLTNLVLDFMDGQTQRRIVVTLNDFVAKMKEFMKFDGRKVLTHRGSVSMSVAKQKASDELRTYKARIRSEREAAGERALRDLGSTAKAIEGGRKKPRSKRKAVG